MLFSELTDPRLTFFQLCHTATVFTIGHIDAVS